MKLLIVESPAKSKTIEKYLGSDFKVMASIGHVRDLKNSDGSIDTENDFQMKWEIMKDKEKQIKAIEAELKKADTLYLATDQDREGEAIAWHLYDILNKRKDLKDKKVERITFNEITKSAVSNALKNPREIDENLVDAYMARRALDYLVGFNLSPVLWRKLPGAKSAGRVQSVALWLVVEREKEIEKFKPVEYWSLDVNAETEKAENFSARLTKFQGKKIEKMTLENKDVVDNVLAKISENSPAKVISLEKKQTSRKPVAPFTTSTLQQEASRKLHFGAQKTMRTAQTLYEKGFITYMRTDAVNLSDEAVAAIRDYILNSIGNDYLPAKPIVYANKSKNAQEAHEAIRPSKMDRVDVSGELDADCAKLYSLIWKRTIACQMTNAKFDSVVVDLAPVSDLDTIFHAVGTTQVFDGFLKLYQEDVDDAEDDENKKLPALVQGQDLTLKSFKPEQHWTSAPPRYTEASLVKKLEELGVGRPSTYASILGVIVDRKYVELNKQRFFATDRGWIVSEFLAHYFPKIVAVDFTAKLEDNLDEIAEGKMNWKDEVRDFWEPFNGTVKSVSSIRPMDIIEVLNQEMHDHLFKVGDDIKDECEKCGGKLSLKFGKYGGFIACSNYPTCDYSRPLVDNEENSDAAAFVNKGAVVGTDEKSGEEISFRVGKFGPYVQLGDGPTAKRTSAKGETAESMTVEKAMALIEKNKKADSIEIGLHPNTKEPIVYFSTGRYGPYVSCAGVNASVSAKNGQPSLDEAADLIDKAKQRKKFKK